MHMGNLCVVHMHVWTMDVIEQACSQKLNWGSHLVQITCGLVMDDIEIFAYHLKYQGHYKNHDASK